MKKSENYVAGLCSILEKNKALTPQESEDAKKLFKEASEDAFNNFLLQQGLVEKKDLLEALSTYYAVPYFDVIGHFFDHHLVIKFPKGFLIRNKIIPLQEIKGTMLFVVAANPADESLLPKIGRYMSNDIQFLVGIGGDIRKTIQEFSDPSLQVTDDFDYISAEEEDEARAMAQEQLDLDREE